MKQKLELGCKRDFERCKWWVFFAAGASKFSIWGFVPLDPDPTQRSLGGGGVDSSLFFTRTHFLAAAGELPPIVEENLDFD